MLVENAGLAALLGDALSFDAGKAAASGKILPEADGSELPVGEAEGLPAQIMTDDAALLAQLGLIIDTPKNALSGEAAAKSAPAQADTQPALPMANLTPAKPLAELSIANGKASEAISQVTAERKPQSGLGGIPAKAGPANQQSGALSPTGLAMTAPQASPATSAILSQQSAGAPIPVAEILLAKMTGSDPKPEAVPDQMDEAAKLEKIVQQLTGLRDEPGREGRLRATSAMPSAAASIGVEIPSAVQTASLAPAASPFSATASMSGAASASPGGLTNPLDLNAVIDRLVEVRQSAAGGRVQLSVAHDDFGAVGVRFEQAAGAGMVSVALTSADPGFAPAVQAALAERLAAERQPQATDPAARQDAMTGRGEGGNQHGQPHAGQAQTSSDQNRQGTARTAQTEPTASRNDDADDRTQTDSPRAHARGRYA